MIDVVYLKKGDVIRGEIIEQIPNISLKVQLKDKSIFLLRFDDIEKIAKEVDGKLKIPALAWLLSFLWTGAGQLYNGQVTKGIIMLVGCVVFDIILFMVLSNFEVLFPEVMSLFILSRGVWIWSQIDAPIMALKYNR